jgi:hypothetical protein
LESANGQLSATKARSSGSSVADLAVGAGVISARPFTRGDRLDVPPEWLRQCQAQQAD